MADNGAVLVAHSGAQVVTREQLESIPAPPSTQWHRPIAHAELDDILRFGLRSAGYEISRAQYAVQTDGLRLFGAYDLEATTAPGMGTAIAFRHANNKTMGLELVCGGRVFICDNLALIGQTKLFKHRHTHGVIGRLREAVTGYFAKLPQAIQMVQDRVGVWQAAPLSDDEAKVVIYDAIQTGTIPARIRPEVHAAYFDAEKLGFEDCLGRNKWGLHNAFTRSFKALNPGPAYAGNLGLTQLLGTNN